MDLPSLTADFTGHATFCIAAPDASMDIASRELAAQNYPQVPSRGKFEARSSFFCTGKAERVPGWRYSDWSTPPISEYRLSVFSNKDSDSDFDSINT